MAYKMVRQHYNCLEKRKTSSRKPRLKVFEKGLLMTNSDVKDAFLLPQLVNPCFDFNGLFAMWNPFKNLLVDDILSRKRFSCIQRGFLCFEFSNLLSEFSNLSLIIWDLLIKDLLFAETLLFLGLEVTQFFLTVLPKIPLQSHLVDLCFDLKISISKKSEILDQLGKESFKLNQVFGNQSRKLMQGKLIEEFKDVMHQGFFFLDNN